MAGWDSAQILLHLEGQQYLSLGTRSHCFGQGVKILVNFGFRWRLSSSIRVSSSSRQSACFRTLSMGGTIASER